MICKSCQKDGNGVVCNFVGYEPFPLCWNCFNRYANQPVQDREAFVVGLFKGVE